MSIITAIGRADTLSVWTGRSKTQNKRFNLVAASYYTQGDKDKSNIAGLTAACVEKKNHIQSALFFLSTHAHTHAHTQTRSVCKWRGQSVTSVWNAGKGRGVLMCSRYGLVCVLFGNSKLSLCYADEVLWILNGCLFGLERRGNNGRFGMSERVWFYVATVMERWNSLWTEWLSVLEGHRRH